MIDDSLMKDALHSSGAKTKRETVELVLRTLAQRGLRRPARCPQGKIHCEVDLEARPIDG